MSSQIVPALVQVNNGDAGIRYALVPPENLYAAGEDGSIWSQLRIGDTERKPSGVWRRLKQYVGTTGYLHITLRMQDTGKARPYPSHRLVLFAWKGLPASDELVCRHLDGSRTNNVPSNLEWGTDSENMLDRGDHGDPTFRGEGHPQAVLTEAIVIALRARVAAGETVRSAAAALQVSREAAYGAVSGRSWNHIPGAIRSYSSPASPETKQRCRDLKASGMTIQQVVAETGFPYMQVYNCAFRKT